MNRGLITWALLLVAPLIVSCLPFEPQNVEAFQWPDAISQPCGQLAAPNTEDIEISFDDGFSSRILLQAQTLIKSGSSRIPASARTPISFTARVQGDKTECHIGGSGRLSGDFSDHLGNGLEFGPTIHVVLETGSALNGANAFKLFTESSDKDFEESLVSNVLFAAAGIPSPTVRPVVVNLGEMTYRTLFQDVSADQFEIQGFRPGPVLEFNELPLWESGFNYNANGATFRLESEDFARSSREHEAMSLRALAVANASVRWPTASDPTGNAAPTLQDTSGRSPRLGLFAFLAIAGDGWHGLQLHNRKVIVDPLTTEILPVEYDVDAGFLRLSRLFSGLGLDVSETNPRLPGLVAREAENLGAVVPFDARLDDYYWAEVGTSLASLQTRGWLTADFSTDSLRSYITTVGSYVEELLPEISSPFSLSLPDELARVDQLSLDQLSLVRTLILEDRALVELADSGEIEVQTCWQAGRLQQVGDCWRESLRGNPLREFLQQRQEPLSIEDRTYPVWAEVMAGDAKDLVPLLGGRWSLGGIPGLFLTGEVALDVERIEDRTSVTIRLRSPDARVLFFDLELRDVEITVSSHGALLRKLPREHEVSVDGLTGCLSFLNVDFRDVWIRSEGGFCEDQVHIDSSKGSIRAIDLDFSLADGLDIDRSALDIDRLFVADARNDCVDLSHGTYKIGMAKLVNCGDKAISVGENSHVGILGGEIRSRVGVVAKDGSSVDFEGSLYVRASVACWGLYVKKPAYPPPMFLNRDQLKCSS